MATSTMQMNRTLSITKEEAELLLGILEEAYRAKQIEVHRTDALAYKQELEREEKTLGELVDKLRQSATA